MVIYVKRGSSPEVLEQALAKLKQHKQEKKKCFNPDKYCGILSLDEDPIVLQKKWRGKV